MPEPRARIATKGQILRGWVRCGPPAMVRWSGWRDRVGRRVGRLLGEKINLRGRDGSREDIDL